MPNTLFCPQFRDAKGNLLEPELVSPPLKRLHAVMAEAKGDSKVDLSDGGGGGGRLRNSSGDQENNSKDLPVSVNERMCASQPAFRSGANGGKPPLTPTNGGAGGGGVGVRESFNFGGFTQPAQMSDLFCGSQSTQGTQGSSSQTHFQRLVKRMTRFWVSTDMSETQR